MKKHIEKLNEIGFDDFPSMTVVVDYDGKLLFINDTLLNSHDLAIKPAAGKMFKDVFCMNEQEGIYFTDILQSFRQDNGKIIPFITTVQIRNEEIKVLWNGKKKNVSEEEAGQIVLSGNIFQDCINNYFNAVPILQYCCTPVMFLSPQGKLKEYYRVSKDFLHILNEQSELIVLCSPDGKINFANNTYRKCFNLPDDMSNVYHTPPFSPEDNAFEITFSKPLAPDNSTVIYEQKYHIHSSEVIWIHWIIKAYYSEEGSLIEYQATGRDFTEKKVADLEKERLIIELERTNAQLKELAQMKDDFLAIASHDMRSPSMCISGYADLLMKSSVLTTDDKLYINMIKVAAENQLQYINDLLDIIKLQSGKLKLKIDRFSISEIVSYSVKSHLILATKKGIDFQSNIHVNKSVNIDKAKIIQVLNNLISNAIKFTPCGGKISVWCFENNSNEIEIHVKDNGVGISEDKIELLFSPFYQYHTDGTEGEPGTGLGLAICKNFVELHNGNLGVTSFAGKGTDFYFTLPLP